MFKTFKNYMLLIKKQSEWGTFWPLCEFYLEIEYHLKLHFNHTSKQRESRYNHVYKYAISNLSIHIYYLIHRLQYTTFFVYNVFDLAVNYMNVNSMFAIQTMFCSKPTTAGRSEHIIS